MREESFSFLKVTELCRREVVRCDPGDDILEVAGRMRKENISSIVVCHEAKPVGIITDRDLRNRLSEIAGASGRIPASAVMTAPVTTVGEDEYVFEAIYRMARNGIHRLVVVDGRGRLAGILTDTDVIRLQLTTPLYFGRDIEGARSLGELAGLNAGMVDIVSYACRTGAKAADAVRLIAHFNDAFCRKAIELLLCEDGGAVSDRFAFVALGSEGRGEQTLKTDQDNAVIYDDDLDEADVAALGAFSGRLIDALVAIGVPPCPGGTMANDPRWRRSLSGWSRLVEQWISVPNPENMVSFGMFCDLRTVYGRPEYERRLKQVIREAVGRSALFLACMARNILRFPPALGLFGRLKTERTGKDKGKIDLKKAGIFAITEGVTVLALEAGVLDGGTREKIQALKDRGALAARDLDAVDAAFTFLLHLRLRHQLARIQAGEKLDNCIAPTDLSSGNVTRLKEALSAVESFQRYLREHFKLDLIPH